MLIIILYHSKTVVFEWYICYTYVKNIQVLYYYGQNKNFVLKGGRQKKAFCKIKYQISKVGRGLIDKKIF